MKRKRMLLRVGLALFVLAAVLVGGALGLVWVMGPPTHEGYDPGAFELKAEGDAAAGKRLATMLCVRCHYDAETNTLAGRALAPEYKAIGKAHAANLTRDDVRGIGSWRDAEVVMMLRSGVHPQRKELVPHYMPFLPNIADVDLANLVAFLRSDDPWVAPQRKADPRSVPAYGTVLRAWLKPSLGPREASLVLKPKESEPVALGAYLANDLFQCHGCHSASVQGADWVSPADSKGFYKGGAKLTDLAGNRIVAPGLTAREDGIGGWAYEDFRRALLHGVTPDGDALRWPMPRYAQLSEGELSALYAYFQTLPAAESSPKRPAPYKVVTRIVDPGRHAFERLGCPSCHSTNAEGVLSLKKALEHYPDDASLRAYIENPQALDPDAWMPAYGKIVDDAEMVALLEYVRRRIERGPYAPPPKG